MRYIIWAVALLEVCDVTNNGHHLGRHLGFYQELEIRLKAQEMVIFYAGHVEEHMNKNFAPFYPQSLLLLLNAVEKTCIFTKKWLDHLLRMTSNLVTIVTDYY